MLGIIVPVATARPFLLNGEERILALRPRRRTPSSQRGAPRWARQIHPRMWNGTVNVAHFGSTGTIGRPVLARLLADGHRVSVLVRDPSRLHETHDHLQVIVGDVLDPDAVARTVDGVEAAIVTLGARQEGDQESVVSKGLTNIVPAMERAGARRLLFMSILGVGETLSQAGMARFILPLVMGEALKDRAVAEEIVKASSLEWIIVRAARIVRGESTGGPKVGEDLKVGLMTTTRLGDLATFLAGSLTDGRFVGKAPTIAS